MSPKVSVVIPCYNCIDYLEESVRSVLAQTLRELEILIVDDGSTDGSGALADSLAAQDDRIRVIHQKNGGLPVARNSGIDAACGEYIAFLDADDLVLPNAYETLYQTAVSLSCEVVTCAYQSFRDTKIMNPVRPNFPFYSRLNAQWIRQEMPRLAQDDSLPFVWRRLYAGTLFREKGVRFDPAIRVCEDATFCMECLLRADGVAAVPDCLYRYRIVPTSLIRSKKYNPYLTASLLRQYDEKKKLSDAYMPEQTQALLCTLAENTYRHISRLIFFNVFRKDGGQYREFRAAVHAPIFRDMRRWFDLRAHRSRSLEWFIFLCLRLRLYFPAFCIAKRIFGKDN